MSGPTPPRPPIPRSTFGAGDRRAVVSVATQFFVNGAVFASFVPRLPEIRDRLEVTVGVLGALMTMAGVIGLIGSFTASRIIERFGTRTVLIGGASILVASLPIIGFATTPAVFVVGLAIMLIFDVLVDVAMNLQGSWLSTRRHAPIVNRLHGLWSLGTVTGGIAAAQITAAGVSLQAHLVAVALIMALAVVFVSRGLLRVDEHAPEAIVAPAVLPAPGPMSRHVPPRRRLPLALFALAGGFAIAVEIVSSDWAAFRMSDDFATSAGFAGLAYVAYTSGMTTGRFGGDWAQQRLGPAGLMRVATAIAAIGLAGAALFPWRHAVLVAYVLAGIGVSTFFPRLYDEAAKVPGKRGAGLGSLTAGSRITALAVPTIVGSLAATSLSVGSAVAIVTLPSIIGFAIVGWLRHRPGSGLVSGPPR